MPRIFQDDPHALDKLNLKLEGLEKNKEYCKGIKKTKPRPYDSSLGDQRWYMLDNVTTNIRSVKKKIAQIQSRLDKNIKLERKTTFKNGKKVFYYVEKEFKK